MFAETFILFYLAHLAADYPGQTDRQAERKSGWTEGKDHPNPGRHHHGWGANLAHAATHIALCAATLAIGNAALELGLTPGPAALALLWIGATHAFIDRRRIVAWWMRNTGQADYLTRGGAAHIDQTAHLLALGIAALALTA
jgi:hypothetical protein